MKRMFAAAGLVLALALSVPAMAPAQDALGAAKAAGQIGERPDEIGRAHV